MASTEARGELRRLLAEATPGPWISHEFGYAGDEEPRSIIIQSGKFDHAAARAGELVASLAWERQESVDAALIVALRNNAESLLDAADRALPNPEDGCVCRHHFQDAGGGYSEHIVEYVPDCPEHSEHLYDPRQGGWIFADPNADRDWWKEQAQVAQSELDRLRAENARLGRELKARGLAHVLKGGDRG